MGRRLTGNKMAIRLREIGGELIAICAAYSQPKKNDLYLDDRQHYALGCKFARDRNYMFPEEANMSDTTNDTLARQECGCPTHQTKFTKDANNG